MTQLTLDNLERPLPELPHEKWAELYRHADKVARDYWGNRYYSDDDGWVALIQWGPSYTRAAEGPIRIWGQRQTEWRLAKTPTLSEWFTEIDSHVGQVGGFVAAWLIPMTQLAQLAHTSAK